MNIAEKWSEKLKKSEEILPRLAKINSVSSAFNTNIDAIVVVSGDKFSKLIEQRNISLDFLQNYKGRNAENFMEVFCGIFKCFTQGIAEEWMSSNPCLCAEILACFPPLKMQIGGQGGIIANLLSICKVQNVVVHTNSLPKMQAEQFLKNDNLSGFDSDGKLQKITEICRENDAPLVHIIFEFQKDDAIIVGGQKFVCPKSNRFIMSCDELNQKLVTDGNFMRYMGKNPQDYCFLSGFHLLKKESAIEVLPEIKNNIRNWKKSAQKKCIFHLEIASTSDGEVLKMIVDEIGKSADSIGLNEREAIDVMQALGIKQNFAPNAVDMYKAVMLLRKYTGAPRIELHMLGIFMTVQDKNFANTAQESLNGMLLASRVSASRATLGDLKKYEDLLSAEDTEISEIGLRELQSLAEHIGDKNFATSGIYCGEDYDFIAIPTPLVKKPAGLVGMGDTISSISLIGAR